VNDALAHARLFRGLPPDALERLRASGQMRTFPPGALLLRQGDPSESLHVILSGRVRVEFAAHGQTSTLALREIGPGEVVGEMGLLEGAPRSASVLAIEQTTTLELGLAAVVLLITQHAPAAAALLRSMGERLRGDTEMIAAAREEAARLEGVLLAVRTLEHYLNNQLARTVGYCELLAEDQRLLPEAREIARRARAGALEAAQTVQRFRRIRRVRTLADGDLPTILDVEHAFAASEGAARRPWRSEPEPPD